MEEPTEDAPLREFVLRARHSSSNIEGKGAGPKYKQIYANLRNALANRDYSPGDRLPSENELVERFGASRPTVSRALAQLELDGLVMRKAGSGTFVRSKEEQKNLVFGLLIPDLGVTEVFEPICRGISIARVDGHHDLLWGSTLSHGAPSEDQAEQLCAYYLQKKVSGIFFAPLELTGKKDEMNQRIARTINEAQIPIVLLDRDICVYPERSKHDLIAIDNCRAGYVITRHMLEVGARRIVFLSRPNSAPTVAERAIGFKEALATYKESNTSGWIEFGDPGDTAMVGGLMAKHKPDGFVCANDYTAARLMTSLNTLGIDIPSEVKVTGMDDVRYASLLQTPLTTIQQPCLELGAAALATMLDRIAHPAMPVRDIFVDFKLVVRQSTTGTNAGGPGHETPST
jgi:GntR family transcriptional regulator of arabinose operon